MSVALGLVGLPNAGKSTLFNSLVARAGGGARAAVASYPLTSIDPNLGQVPVPDDRLAAIASVTHPQRIVPATIRFIDIAGLVRGASTGEGLGNRFLAHIRDVDAIVHVVRVFASADVSHVEGAPDPVRDADIVETELALADLETVQHAIERLESRVKARAAGAGEQAAMLRDLAKELAKGVPVRRQRVDGAGHALIRDLRLLTERPVIYVANVDEASLPDGGPQAAALRALADRQGAACVPNLRLSWGKGGNPLPHPHQKGVVGRRAEPQERAPGVVHDLADGIEQQKPEPLGPGRPEISE